MRFPLRIKGISYYDTASFVIEKKENHKKCVM